ncbi:hypothetical protein ABK040_000166 [Willaertia magna]
MKDIIVLDDFLSKEEELEVLNFIDSKPWSASLERKTQQYGYVYDHLTQTIAGKPKKIPNQLLKLIMKVKESLKELKDVDFNQIIVNEYLGKYQGISKHVDNCILFDEFIIVISLLNPCIMRLNELEKVPVVQLQSKNIQRKEKNNKNKMDLVLQPGSMLCLSGDARYNFQHEIPKGKSMKATNLISEQRENHAMTNNDETIQPTVIPYFQLGERVQFRDKSQTVDKIGYVYHKKASSLHEKERVPKCVVYMLSEEKYWVLEWLLMKENNLPVGERLFESDNPSSTSHHNDNYSTQQQVNSGASRSIHKSASQTSIQSIANTNNVNNYNNNNTGGLGMPRSSSHTSLHLLTNNNNNNAYHSNNMMVDEDEGMIPQQPEDSEIPGNINNGMNNNQNLTEQQLYGMMVNNNNVNNLMNNGMMDSNKIAEYKRQVLLNKLQRQQQQILNNANNNTNNNGFVNNGLKSQQPLNNNFNNNFNGQQLNNNNNNEMLMMLNMMKQNSNGNRSINVPARYALTPSQGLFNQSTMEGKSLRATVINPVVSYEGELLGMMRNNDFIHSSPLLLSVPPQEEPGFALLVLIKNNVPITSPVLFEYMSK